MVSVPSTLDLVARMRRESFSRNRNFEVFAHADGESLEARRLWRYLRSLERDLIAYATANLRVELRAGGGHRITIEVPEVRMKRTALVTAEEYALLREHPDARARLDQASRTE